MTTRSYSHTQHDATDGSMFWENDTIDAGSSVESDPAAALGFRFSAFSSSATVPVGQSLYLTEAGDATAISVNDIHQGQYGDCFLLSSFGEEALFHPNAITNMIHDNGNSTETVTFFLASTGRLPGFSSTSFKSTTVIVNNSFAASSVNNGASQDVVGNLKEIWPQVIEKAYATLGGGTGAIANGGSPVIAMEELTGHSASSMSPASLTFDVLKQDIASGALIVMDTSSRSGLPYGLVSNHAYMFEKLIGSGSSATVQLHNPWGSDQPAAIALNKLAQAGIVEVDIGRLA
jgi:hypothetical protein